ncbi:MCE family protein [Saccharopolyspora hordei]|uniref:Virulence factor Mce-like protein n=1 Tax=Saccharopolyspora hordei TaxID=1838 RepID=A0A853AST1_9PSEU|nr:MCE family protein [Saccharopolyspora hordei]NYI85461.1 virulence factor Mce-like protein [Saccharopolyspora hordei]
MRKLVGIGCALVLVAAAGLWWVFSDPGKPLTAFFDKAVGLYAGSSVRVLGVEVGRIDAVVPQGEVVRVDMHLDDDVPVPADVKAVVVAPSLVSDRYVQLTPAYSGGPELEAGAVLGEDRTATPAELDDLYRSAKALAEALGPDGANREGAVTDLLGTSADVLEGNGADLNATVQRLGELAGTLQENQGDLFSTVDNLNRFTAALAASDEQIRQFHGRLADVTGFLAEDQDEMGAALSSLSAALGDVTTFIRDNREQIASNVENLTGVTQALVDEREALAEVLDVAPLGATNFINAYDAASGSVSVRGHFNELTQSPILMICKLVQNTTPEPLPGEIKKACDELAPLLDDALQLPSVGEALHHVQQGELPPLPLVGQVPGGGNP